MFSEFNSNKVTFSSTTQDVLIVDFIITGSLSPFVTQLYHTLSNIVHKGNDFTTRQTAANKVRQKLSIFLMSI